MSSYSNEAYRKLCQAGFAAGFTMLDMAALAPTVPVAILRDEWAKFSPPPEPPAGILPEQLWEASGFVVAEYRIDKSNSLEDYWGSTATTCRIVGLTQSARMSFATLHRIAQVTPGLESLRGATPDERKALEHRENYSGGAGNYLSVGDINDTGWKLRWRPIAALQYHVDKGDGLAGGRVRLW